MIKIKCLVCGMILYPSIEGSFCPCHNEASFMIRDGEVCIGANSLKDIEIFDTEDQQFREIGI